MVKQNIDQVYTERVMSKYCQDKNIDCLSARKYTLQAFEAGEVFKTKQHYESKTHKIISQGLATDIQELILRSKFK